MLKDTLRACYESAGHGGVDGCTYVNQWELAQKPTAEREEQARQPGADEGDPPGPRGSSSGSTAQHALVNAHASKAQLAVWFASFLKGG